MKYSIFLLICSILIDNAKCGCGQHSKKDVNSKINSTIAYTEPKLKVYTTPVTFDYPDWIQAPKNERLNFKVLATHITLNLAPLPLNVFPKIEIGLDHFADFTCTFWKNNDATLREHYTKFLDGKKFIGFWVSWKNGIIEIGLEGTEKSFSQWKDPIPFPINFIGFHTSKGKPGVWIIEE